MTEPSEPCLPMSRKPFVFSRKLLGSRVKEEMTWKGLPPLEAPFTILGSEKSPMIKLISKAFFRHYSVSEEYLWEASLDLDFCAFHLNEDNASVVILRLHLNGKTRNQDGRCHPENLANHLTHLLWKKREGREKERRELTVCSLPKRAFALPLPEKN